MVFQDPMSALDPMFTVGTLLTSAVKAHQKVRSTVAKKISPSRRSPTPASKTRSVASTSTRSSSPAVSRSV